MNYARRHGCIVQVCVCLYVYITTGVRYMYVK